MANSKWYCLVFRQDLLPLLNMVWMKSIFIFTGANAMLSWGLYVSANVNASSIVVDILHFCALDLNALLQVTVLCMLGLNLKSNMQGTDGHICGIWIGIVSTHCFQLTSCIWSFHYSSLNTTDNTYMSNVPTWPTQQIHALLQYYIFKYNSEYCK